jgi:hypothetical protein
MLQFVTANGWVEATYEVSNEHWIINRDQQGSNKNADP